jgi:hypothetical protein
VVLAERVARTVNVKTARCYIVARHLLTKVKGSTVSPATSLSVKLLVFCFFKVIYTLQYMFRPTWPLLGVKFVVWWKLLCFRYRGLDLFVCCPIYALVYSRVRGRSLCCFV